MSQACVRCLQVRDLWEFPRESRVCIPCLKAERYFSVRKSEGHSSHPRSNREETRDD